MKYKTNQNKNMNQKLKGFVLSCSFDQHPKNLTISEKQNKNTNYQQRKLIAKHLQKMASF